jgi:hypothetical protein
MSTKGLEAKRRDEQLVEKIAVRPNGASGAVEVDTTDPQVPETETDETDAGTDPKKGKTKHTLETMTTDDDIKSETELVRLCIDFCVAGSQSGHDFGARTHVRSQVPHDG